MTMRVPRKDAASREWVDMTYATTGGSSLWKHPEPSHQTNETSSRRGALDPDTSTGSDAYPDSPASRADPGEDLGAASYSKATASRFTAYSGAGTATGAQTNGHEAPADEEPHTVDDFAVVLHRSRGIQVGDHNVQFNTYDCTLEELDLDLESVLGRPGVAEALDALALDPDDAGLRSAADRALGKQGFFSEKPKVRLERGAAGTDPMALR
jgi:hypothetical protein